MYIGDSWCSIQESEWMSTSRKHLISSLSCRHLPNVGSTTGLTLTVKAFDGAIEFQRELPAIGHPNTPTSSDDCFDWLVPVGEFTSGLSRTRCAHVGDALTLNFSFLFLCNRSLDAIRLSWHGDLPATNSSSSSSYHLDVLPTAANFTGSPRCSELNYTYNVSDDVTVTCRGAPLSPDDGSCAYYVAIELSVVEHHHAGAYNVMFRSGSQSVSYSVELVVLDRGTSAAVGSAPFRLRLRTCSNTTWVDAKVGARTTEYRLRQLVPDCVRCKASGSAAVDVQLLRSDGLILGSEDAHSVYWYRDGERAHVAVLLLRAPSDDYSADYYCVASASGPLRPEVDSKKRRLTRKYVRRIRFRLTVQ